MIANGTSLLGFCPLELTQAGGSEPAASLQAPAAAHRNIAVYSHPTSLDSKAKTAGFETFPSRR